MLTLDALTMKIGNKTILDGCSLNMEPGTILALLGPSGSGKTTIIRAIQGLNTPDSGSISFAGTTYTEHGQHKVPPEQRPFAYLFQNFTLFPHLDVKKNITIGIRHRPKAERREALDRYGALLGIEHLFDRDIHALSGGEQQRIAFARTLTLSPQLLLLDEPFSNLDTMTKDHLYHDIKQLIRDQNMSAILATHDQKEAFYFADRLALMREGQIVADGQPQALYQQPPNEWVARFTGDLNLLTAEELKQCFGTERADGGRWMLRPEHIGLTACDKDQAQAHVTSISYHGTITRYGIRHRTGTSLQSMALGVPLVGEGDAIDLVLQGDPVRVDA